MRSLFLLASFGSAALAAIIFAVQDRATRRRRAAAIARPRRATEQQGEQ